MIELTNLTAGYGGVQKLHIDRFALKPSEIVSIIGNNGSGKSTLLKTIDGQLEYRGNVLIDEKEVSRLPAKKRARMISFLPQQVLPVDMSVALLISHGRFSFGDFSHTLNAEDKAAIEDALKMVRLESYRQKKVSDLSGGERTLSYLAMVIAQKSRYMLLDEPLSDIDIPHKLHICKILENLKKSGTGILIASHDIPMSFSISYRICVLDGGEIVVCGTPSEVAAQDEMMKKTLGACVRANGDGDMLYKYSLYARAETYS